MSHLLQDRRAEIRANGREMRLMVPARSGQAEVSVTLLGMPRAYRPQEIQGGVQANDQQVEILNDEIAAAGFPMPPDQYTRLVVDGRTTTIKGVRGVYDGALLIGWSIWTKGA
ncbi:hypothetical protein WDZ11_14805 [Roseomonas mucosa]|uniref:hypothetical protein n=1 Tax=Roseomonas mucosa TaxID=207340 RepID=UPI0030CE958B